MAFNNRKTCSVYSILWWLFPMALLFYLCLTKHPPQVPVNIPHFDKVEHFTAYVLLGLWYFRSQKRWTQLLLVSAVLMAIGIAIEYLQDLVGRDFEYADMAADGVGILTGLLLYLYTAIQVPIDWIKKLLGVTP